MNTPFWFRRAATRLAAATLLLGAAHASPAQTPPSAPPTTAQLAAYVRQFAQAGRFSGTVLVADQDRVLLAQGYGLADQGRREANTSATRFRIGSLSKQFTAVLVLQLVEQGQLKLDGTVADYLPDYPLPAGRQITLHQLLSHTAGLPDFTRLPVFAELARQPRTPAQLVASFAQEPLEFAPGTQFAYSNSGYVLLGAILERVTGQPYGQLLRERIARPLRLTATSYDLALPTGPGRATGYGSGADSLTAAFALNPTLAYAAGGITSTAPDLYRWSQALDGNKVLSAASRQRLFAPVRNHYAYGWLALTTALGPDSLRTQEHNGAINGFTSLLVRVPQRQQCLVLLDNHADPTLPELRRGLLRLLHQLPASPPLVAARPAASGPGAPTATQLAAYVGVYELAPTFRIIVRERGGQLYVQATGQQEFATDATTAALFTLRGVPAKVEFVADAQGRVGQLVLHQGGRDTPAPRVE
ncbi:serine hydrolase [Hymenobacter sp. RP-2-7]|uniref:Serine hydrolase n=1 Tax=Hymenobacter polaris TaxID=2682546 RepID=A0A7Y0AG11_9BACT|nr:serine hydrolase [Hymenobacter polaris]NML66679.1 serine hydrolase [Hymenobacter polaris]